MVNRVILIGNLGRDPEVRRLESGAVVAKFSMATSDSYRDKEGKWQEQVEWHDIVVWRGLAERAEKYLKKGSMIYLEGKLTHRSWQDADGNQRRTTEVVASYYRMLDKKQGDQADRPSDAPASHAAPLPTEAPQESTDSGADDLPF
ncbi:MAG: single-stranded DNA-binding protein [Haliscomenobacter sp.]